MQFNDLSEFDRGWVVGIVEGEGTFRSRNLTQKPGVVVSQKDPEILEKLKGFLGGNLYDYTHKSPTTGHYGTAALWRWTLNGRAAVDLMVAVRPSMSVRRQQQIDGKLGKYSGEYALGNAI